jgi:hypothetical protein
LALREGAGARARARARLTRRASPPQFQSRMHVISKTGEALPVEGGGSGDASATQGRRAAAALAR